MLLEKAIEILQRKRETDSGGELGEDWDAINLAIEALKRIYTSRRTKHHGLKMLLPGEK